MTEPDGHVDRPDAQAEVLDHAVALGRGADQDRRPEQPEPEERLEDGDQPTAARRVGASSTWPVDARRRCRAPPARSARGSPRPAPSSHGRGQRPADDSATQPPADGVAERPAWGRPRRRMSAARSGQLRERVAAEQGQRDDGRGGRRSCQPRGTDRPSAWRSHRSWVIGCGSSAEAVDPHRAGRRSRRTGWWRRARGSRAGRSDEHMAGRYRWPPEAPGAGDGPSRAGAASGPARPLAWRHEPAGPAASPASAAAARRGPGPGRPRPGGRARAGPSGRSGCCSACSSASCSSPPTPAATAASRSPTPTFLDQAEQGKVESIQYDNGNADITGKFKDGDEFTTTGLTPFPDADLALLREHDVEIKPKTQTPELPRARGCRSCCRSR